jgi:hypothetical protein
MPLFSGSDDDTISDNIKELHKGPTFARTAAKFGKQKARSQAIAIAMKEAGKSKKPDESEKKDENPKEEKDEPKKIGLMRSDKKIGYKPYTEDGGVGVNSTV